MDGLLYQVVVETQGSETTADVAAGATSVPVEDLTDFQDGSGRALIADVAYDWTGVDDSTVDGEGVGGALLLAEPGLVADVPDFTPVDVLAGDEAAADYYADVIDPEADEDAQPIRAHLVTREERIAWPVRTYDPPVGVGLYVDEQGRWRVGEVKGVVPVMSPDSLDRTRLTEIITEDAPAGGGVGQTFEDRAPDELDLVGKAEGHAWWQFDTLDPVPPAVSQLVAFFRVQGGAWVPGSVVNADAAVFQNAIIGALQATGLTAIRIDGGSIYIAQGEAGSVSQGFSGTSLPAGWGSTKTDFYAGPLDGTEGSAVPGASVVSTGPAGQVGSALLIDYGPVGGSTDAAEAAGAVTLPLGNVADVDFKVRYRAAQGGASENVDHARLALRSTGTAWDVLSGGSWTAITVDLIPSGFFDDQFSGTYYISGDEFEFSTSDVALDVTQWCWTRLMSQGSRVFVKWWQDSDPEPPAWQATIETGTIPLAPGRVELVWRQNVASRSARGQKLWVDQVSAVATAAGFQVTPDGVMTCPANGIGLGDAAWRTVGASGQPGFQNGWAAWSGESLAFRKSPTGDVVVSGDLAIPASASGTVIFTLPAGYRPSRDLGRNFAYQNASPWGATVFVNADGTVVWTNLGNSAGTRTEFTVTFPV